MITFKMIESSELNPYLEQFHIYGHGIENGLSPEEHLRRLKVECQGLNGLLILKDNLACALITFIPNLVEDIHFIGLGLCCIHFAGSGLGYSGVKALHRALATMARESSASWYSISRRVSKYEYLNRYYMLRS